MLTIKAATDEKWHLGGSSTHCLWVAINCGERSFYVRIMKNDEFGCGQYNGNGSSYKLKPNINWSCFQE